MDIGRLLPTFWTQSCETSNAWDKALNFALDKYGIEAVGAHEAQIGPFTVWACNYPYSFGYNTGDSIRMLPRVRTRRRLRRAIEAFNTAQYMRLMDGG